MNRNYRTFFALATILGLSSMGCASGMRSSKSAVHGDFEAVSTGAVAPQGPSAPPPDAPQNYRASVHAEREFASSTATADIDGANDLDDLRVADNTQAAPPQPAPKVANDASKAPNAVSAAAPDKRGTMRSVAPGSGGGSSSPPLPPPGGSAAQASTPKGPPPSDAAKQQMLVYTANLQMAVYLVEPGLAQVEKIAKDMGGYLASRGDNKIEIRVPREKFQDALKAVEATGDVLHRDVQASDVTDQYVDMESRLRNAKVIRARLQALLERAAVKEALEIERELGRVTQEIEVLEGKMKLLRDKVAFSTITVQYAPKAHSLQKTAFALPFPWLSQLGLPNLLKLRDHKGDN